MTEEGSFTSFPSSFLAKSGHEEAQKEGPSGVNIRPEVRSCGRGNTRIPRSAEREREGEQRREGEERREEGREEGKRDGGKKGRREGRR